MGNCHWHWVKAKSCDVVQAHKSCTSHAHWRNAITFTRMRSFLLAWTRTLGFVGLTISRNATELFRHVLFYATFYDSPLLGRSLFIIFFFFIFFAALRRWRILVRKSFVIASLTFDFSASHVILVLMTNEFYNGQRRV